MPPSARIAVREIPGPSHWDDLLDALVDRVGPERAPARAGAPLIPNGPEHQ